MRLIDADELLFTLEKEQEYLEKERLTDRSFGIGDAIIDLCSAPTIDAVEVVRSKWVEAKEIGDCCYTCLNCGFVRDAYLLDTANYCPNCGAKMEEEE